MENIQELLKETNLKIDQSIASVFTKDDVKALLYTFAKDSDQFIIDIEELGNILERVIESEHDLVDYSSAEFELDYDNIITLQNVELNTDSIIDKVLYRMKNLKE